MDMGYRLLSQRVAHRHPLIPSYLIKYSRFWRLPFLFSALASTIRCTFDYSLWSLGTSDAGLRVLEADIHAASSGSYNVSTFWTPRFYIATFSREFPTLKLERCPGKCARLPHQVADIQYMWTWYLAAEDQAESLLWSVCVFIYMNAWSTPGWIPIFLLWESRGEE